MPVNKSVYLGDGVYAEDDGYYIRLYTSDGFGKSDVICLDIDVFQALVKYGNQTFGLEEQ